MPRADSVSSSRRQVPTGTVDFTATTVPGRMTSLSSATAQSTARRSALPSTLVGVGTQTNTMSRSASDR
jgi:hypothetical protein